MTASENFVARWARLKRNADPRRLTEGLTDKPPPSTSDLSVDSTEAGISQPRSDAATTAALFDPAGLPSIEAITSQHRHPRVSAKPRTSSSHFAF